jgi:hypothetical protein
MFVMAGVTGMPRLGCGSSMGRVRHPDLMCVAGVIVSTSARWVDLWVPGVTRFHGSGGAMAVVMLMVFHIVLNWSR